MSYKKKRIVLIIMNNNNDNNDTNLSLMLHTQCSITPASSTYSSLAYRQEAETYLSQWSDEEVIVALEENEGDALLLDCIFKVFCSPEEDWLQDYCTMLHTRVALQTLQLEPLAS